MYFKVIITLANFFKAEFCAAVVLILAFLHYSEPSCNTQLIFPKATFPGNFKTFSSYS